MKRRRPRVTLDQSGKPLAGFFDWFSSDTAANAPDLTQSDFPPQATSDPDILKQIVPTGTPLQPYVTAVAKGFPSEYYDSWYFPTNAAITRGKVQAATDTIVATGDQIGATIQKVANVGESIASNFMPILIGIAALVLFLKYGGKK